jgi:hypothetical protein
MPLSRFTKPLVLGLCFAFALYTTRNFASSAQITTSDADELVAFLIDNNIRDFEGGVTMLGQTSYLVSTPSKLRFIEHKLLREAESKHYGIRIEYRCPLWPNNRIVHSS